MTDVQETLNEVYDALVKYEVWDWVDYASDGSRKPHPLHDLWEHRDSNDRDDGLTVGIDYLDFDHSLCVDSEKRCLTRGRATGDDCHGTGRVVRDISGLPESMVLGWLARLIGLGHLQDFEITEDGNEPVVFAKALLAAVQQELGVEAQS